MALTTGNSPVERSEDDDGLKRRTVNLRTSTRIARFLTIAVVVFVLSAIGFSLWMTREHDRLALRGSEQMVRGGLASLEDTLRTVTMDFAIWPDAVAAVSANDRTWIWENIGISAAVTETTDLMMVQMPDGSAPFGWAPGMDAEPSTTLIPAPAVDKLRALLDKLPIEERSPVTVIFDAGETIWLLSSARIVSADPAEDPASDAQIGRLIFGFRMDDELLREIGSQYLIDDLHLEISPVNPPISIPLIDGTGEAVAYAVWTPPRPGAEILRGIALPFALVLLLLTTIALISSRLLSRSAERLEIALTAAENASHAKTDFIANISHELRTPMNGVFGLGRLLQQTQLNERQKGMVDMLMNSAETQMNLIDDLLDVSSIEHGRFSLTIAPFSPAATVKSVCDVSRIAATTKGLELALEIDDPDGTEVLGDRGRFRQVCANLVGNAVKFTQQGGVTVRLRIRERLGQAFVALEVTDTGPGIPEHEREKIFDRFSRGLRAVGAKTEGSGLGLSIARTIVDLMGGRVTLESSETEGATFRVEIDLDKVDRRANRVG